MPENSLQSLLAKYGATEVDESVPGPTFVAPDPGQPEGVPDQELTALIEQYGGTEVEEYDPVDPAMISDNLDSIYESSYDAGVTPGDIVADLADTTLYYQEPSGFDELPFGLAGDPPGPVMVGFKQAWQEARAEEANIPVLGHLYEIERYSKVLAAAAFLRKFPDPPVLDETVRGRGRGFVADRTGQGSNSPAWLRYPDQKTEYQKMMDGITKWHQNRAVVEEYAVEYMAAKAEQFTVGGAIATGIVQLPAFMTDFVLTGPVFRAFNAPVKLAVQSSLKKMGMKAIGSKVVGLTTGAAVGSVARTLVNIPALTAGTLEEMMPDAKTTKEGTLILSENKSTPLRGFFKTLGKDSIENFSEVAGRALPLSAAMRKFPKFGTLMKALKIEWRATPGNRAKLAGRTVQQYMEAVGFHGFLEEMEEEQLSRVMSAAFGMEDVSQNEDTYWPNLYDAFFPSARELQINAGVIAPLSLLGISARGVAAALTGIQPKPEVGPTREAAAVPAEDLSRTFGDVKEVVTQFHEQKELAIHGISAPIFGNVEAIGKHQAEVKTFTEQVIKTVPRMASVEDRDQVVLDIADAVNTKVQAGQIVDPGAIAELVLHETAAKVIDLQKTQPFISQEFQDQLPKLNPKAKAVIQQALVEGTTDPGTAALATHLMNIDPTFDANSSLEISAELKKALPGMAKSEGMPLVDAKGDPIDYTIAGQTDSDGAMFRAAATNTTIRLFQGHDADTVVEEWYHRAWDRMSPEDQSQYKTWYDTLDKPAKIQEHFARTGRDMFFAKGLQKPAGPLLRIFRKFRESLNKLVRRIRTLQGAKIPKAIEKVFTQAGVKQAGKRQAASKQSKATPKDVSITFQIKPKKIENLGLSEVKDEGNAFKTGRPVTFDFIRNTEPSPELGSRFQQDIEPAGRYMQIKPSTFKEGTGNFIAGSVTFQSPLVLEFNTGKNRTAYNSNSWKARLSDLYGGATGKELSQALIDSGYDGIVTTGRQGETSEIVDLTTFNTSFQLRPLLVSPFDSVVTRGWKQAALTDKDVFIVQRPSGKRRLTNKQTVDNAIREHPAYQEALTNIEETALRLGFGPLYFVHAQFKGDVAQYPNLKGRITFDKSKTFAVWDDAGFDSIDEFLQAYSTFVSLKTSVRGINDQALAIAANADPGIELLIQIRDGLSRGESLAEINAGIDDFAEHFGITDKEQFHVKTRAEMDQGEGRTPEELQQTNWAVQKKIPAKGAYTVVRPDGTAEWVRQAALTSEESQETAERIKGPNVTNKVEQLRAKFIQKIDDAESLRAELRRFINSSLPPSVEKGLALGRLQAISAKSWDKTNIRNFGQALIYVDQMAGELRKKQAINDFKDTLKSLKKQFGTKKTLLGEMRPEFAKPLNDIIESIDVAQLSEGKLGNILGLERKVKELIQAIGAANAGLVDPDLLNEDVVALLEIPDDRIKELNRIGAKSLADMTAEEIEAINFEIARVVSMNNLKNQIIGERDARDRAEVLKDVVADIIPTKRARKGEKPSKAPAIERIRKFASATIPTHIQATTGSLDNATADILLWDVLDGLDDKYQMQKDIKKFALGELNKVGVTHKVVAKWRKKKHEYKMNGRRFTLNEEQLVSILMDIRNAENRVAAQRGYRWRETPLDRVGLGPFGRTFETDTGPLTLENLGVLLTPMTDLHRKAADVANKVLDEKTKGPLAETSVRLYHHDQFRVDKYWAINRIRPIHLDGKKADIKPLSNRGFTHERVGGTSGIWLTPFFSKLHNSIEESSGYAKMMIPIFNAKSILASRDWQIAMRDAGRTDEMAQIIDRFLVLERASTGRDALALFSGQLIRGHARLNLAYNAGSILAQLTSGPMLMNIDIEQYVKHPLLPVSKSIKNEIFTHNGLLWNRLVAGRISKDIGDVRATGATDEFFFDRKELLNRPMGLQTITDAMVVGKAWRMAKGHVEPTGVKQGTPEYWDAVNRRVNELMLTQPQWEPFLRSELLTSEEMITRGLMAFRSPIEAMHNAWLRASADVANKIPGARQGQIMTAASIATALIMYRAVKIAYRSVKEEIPGLFGIEPDFGDDEKEFNPLDGVVEQLILDIVAISPEGKVILGPLMKSVMAGFRKSWPGQSALEGMPLVSLAALADEVAYNIGSMTARKIEGDPNWDAKMQETVHGLITLVSTYPGLPVGEPLRVSKKLIPGETMEEYMSRMEATLYFNAIQNAKKQLEEQQKLIQEAYRKGSK